MNGLDSISAERRDWQERSDSNLTIFQATVERLGPLCAALGMTEDTESIVSSYRRLTEGWGARSVAQGPQWRSHVGDDQTPVEFSVAFAANCELRIMVEPIAHEPSLHANWASAVAVLESLATDFDIDLTRLRAVEELFCPTDPNATFAMWIAAVFARGERTQFKAYLNPDAHGPGRAPAIVQQTLLRLGFGRAWRAISRRLIQRGPEQDELKYLSLDLTPSRTARVKVYARHQRATVHDLENAAAGSPAYRAGDVAAFMSAVAPGRELFDGRAPFTCYAFVQGSRAQPASVTSHYPINGYVVDDKEAESRICAALKALDLEDGPYIRAISAFSNRPLEAGIGLHSYASFRRGTDGPRLTIYLPLELYRPGTIAAPSAPIEPRTVDELVQRLTDADRIRHPLVAGLADSPIEPSARWDLAITLRSLQAQRSSHLASVAARVHLVSVRSAIDSLIEENGEMQRSLWEIDSQRWPSQLRESEDDEMQHRLLALGREFKAQVANAIAAEDVVEAYGALIASEAFMDRASRLLAFGHLASEESRVLLLAEGEGRAFRLARAIPPNWVRGVWNGAQSLERVVWRVWDDVYLLRDDASDRSSHNDD